MNFRGQIMVMALLVLMVLAIVTLGVLSLASRDVQQSVTSQQYESLYNRSEEVVFNLLDKYAKTNAAGALPSLSALTTDFPSACTTVTLNRDYRCNINNTAGDIQSEFRASDLTSFTNYELTKDSVLSIDLGTYRGEIRLAWQGNAAIETTIIYTTATGQYRAIKDVFDKFAVYGSTGSDPFDDVTNTHALSYQTHQTPNTNSFRFNIGTTAGLAATDVTRILLIQPRMSGARGNIFLNFSYDSSTPVMRELLASSRYLGVVDSPVPSARTQIPLAPQMPAIFGGYAFQVGNGTLSK